MALNKNQKLGYIAYISSSVIWGFSFMFTKRALEHLDGRLFDLLSYRFVISSGIMLILWAFKAIKMDFRGKDLKPLIAMAMLQPVLYFIFETLGIERVTTSETGLILAMFPIVITLFGAIFLKERVTRKHYGFIILSVLGVVLINAMSYVPGSSTNLGRIFLMIAVLVGSTYTMLSRKLSSRFSAEERTFAMMLAGAMVFSCASFYGHLVNKTASLYLTSLFKPDFAFPVLYLSVGCSLLAFFFMCFSATHLELSKASVLGNTNTMVAVLAGVIILNEPFYWYHILGGAIILGGVVGATMVSSSMVSKSGA